MHASTMPLACCNIHGLSFDVIVAASRLFTSEEDDDADEGSQLMPGEPGCDLRGE